MQAGLAPIDRHSERDEVSTIDYRVSTVDCRCGIGVRVRKLLDIILLSLLEVEVIELYEWHKLLDKILLSLLEAQII